MRPAVALFLVLLASAAQAAASEPLMPSRRLCNPDKIKHTNAWVDCLQKAIDKSEAELDALVRKISTVMTTGDMLEEPKRSENRALFEATQTKWLALRDDDCKSYGAHKAGLGFGAVQFRLECLINETVSRVLTLRVRYKEDLK